MSNQQSCGEPPQCPNCGSYYIQIDDPNYRQPTYQMTFWPPLRCPTSVIIKLLNKNAHMPEKKSLNAAAYDLYASEGTIIAPGETKVVSTGLSMEIPIGFKGEIYSRSGLACKGIFVANQPGKIDSDYRGEIKVILFNSSSSTFYVHSGDRIAQFEINEVVPIMFHQQRNLSETERGEGGLGSTGVK